MGKMSRKVWVMMLTLALIISQLLPTGILTIAAAAEDGIEIEEMKKEAPAEEKKAEAVPLEEKKIEAADEKAKAEDLSDALKEELKEAEKEVKEEVKEESALAEEAEPEAEAAEMTEEEKAPALKSSSNDIIFSKSEMEKKLALKSETVAYDGEYHHLVPEFLNADSDGRISLTDNNGRKWYGTFHIDSGYQRGLNEKNVGDYSWGVCVRLDKLESSSGTTVYSNNRTWGNWFSVRFENRYVNGFGWTWYTYYPSTLDSEGAIAGFPTLSLSIQRKTIRVKLNSMTKSYGQKDPDRSTWATLTSGELASGDDLGKLLNLQRENGEDVGIYKFRVSGNSGGGTGGGEAERPWEEARKSPAKEEAVKVVAEEKIDTQEKEKITVKDIGNYRVEFTNTEGQLEIMPVPVVITALDNGKVKGTRDPKLEYTVTGLVNGEALPEGFVYNHKRKAGEEVGKYPISLEINLNAENNSTVPSGGDDEIIDVPVVVEKEEWAEAKEEYAKEELKVEYAAKDAYEYAAKSVKKAAAREAADYKESIVYEEKVKEIIDLSSMIEKEADVYPSEEVKPIEIITPEIPWDNPSISDDVKPTNGFKSKNYTFRIVNGTFTITGTTNGGGTTNNGGNTGGNNDGDNIVVADVNDAATPAAAPAAPAASTTIPDAAAPLAGGNGGAWALVNLICTILAGIGAILAVFRRKEEEDEENADRAEDEEDNRGKKMFAAKAAGILTAIAAIITFILTEDMRLPMILIDRWTLLMVIMLAVQIAAAVLNKKASEAEEDEEAETQTAN